eukprot:TRINITY_DN15964_c0_g2_i4.p1 TRINITY_DN15964_c0_g2~~TRINITY_DN15964_c0_g2_i4.p1  ORF type:complete len:118 (+),score=20.06 TRINITY_DN15964_c0_g2_i4:129-482(+)
MGTAGQFPVVTKRAVGVIEGQETTVLLSGYEDRIMVMVSQIGKLGTILFAKQEEIYDGPKAFQVDTILGKRDEPLLTVCARQLIEKMSMTSDTNTKTKGLTGITVYITLGHFPLLLW